MSSQVIQLRVERPDPVVVKALRGKTPAERCQLAFDSNRLVRERLRAHLSREHADWTDAQIAAEIARRALWNKLALALQRLNSS